jgi:Uncharacterized alpha/beta hydrolase domain (DUF2235)
VFIVKNIVLCFDHDRANSRAGTNVRALFDLLDDHDQADQLTWYHSGVREPSRTARDDGRPHSSLADAYLFLVEVFEPGDRIFVFGAGSGAYCARALIRLLNAAGVLPADSDLLDYALAHWVLPHTHRTAEDWARLSRLAADLTGAEPVPVRFLGLWDTMKIPGLQRLSQQERDTDRMDNVLGGRHVVALDEHRVPTGEHLLSDAAAGHLEEVWFRGTHADVIGAACGNSGLGRITLEWILDGARRAGLWLRDGVADQLPFSTERDVLSGGRRVPKLLARTLPDGSLVHASVEIYLREHPEYWHRLPHRVVWADTEWPARSERLIAPPDTPRVTVQAVELAS